MLLITIQNENRISKRERERGTKHIILIGNDDKNDEREKKKVFFVGIRQKAWIKNLSQHNITWD